MRKESSDDRERFEKDIEDEPVDRSQLRVNCLVGAALRA
jgi:hypothetical protein